MKRITIVLLSMLCMINVYAQQDGNTNVSGDDAGWDDTSVSQKKADSDKSAIYDLTGKKIEANDITALPPGIYISNERKILINVKE